MAPRQVAARVAEETSEREYQATVNAAVASTEDEIFTDALGADELDNDGDTSLEEMGDGLEGDVEDDEAEEGEGEEGEVEAQGEEGDEAESAEGEDASEGEQEPARGQDGRFQPQDDRRVPAFRQKQEADRRRAAEERVQTLERTVSEYNGRIAQLSAQVNAQPQRTAAQEPPPPKPDMFAEPEKYEAWLMAEAERKADAKMEQRFGMFQREQQARELQRVDRALEAAARGPRAFEFSAAYNSLTSLDPRDRQAQAVVNGILTAPDPAKAMFEWWDENGGPEYRDQVLQQLMPDQRRGNARNGANGAGQQRQPRHEFRPAQRLPSLNSATGSNVQRVGDPEMLDGSERSVFDYGARRQG